MQAAHGAGAGPAAAHTGPLAARCESTERIAKHSAAAGLCWWQDRERGGHQSCERGELGRATKKSREDVSRTELPAFEVYPGRAESVHSHCFCALLIAKASHMEVGWERLLGGGALPQLGRKKILVLPLACCCVLLNPRLPARCQRSGSHAHVRVTREGAWQCFKERFFRERAHMRLPASV